MRVGHKNQKGLQPAADQFFHWMDYGQKTLILAFLGLDEFTRKPTLLTFLQKKQQVHPFFETTELGCVLHVVLATRLEWLQKIAALPW